MAHDTKPAVRVGTITETPSESNGGFYVVEVDGEGFIHLIGPGCPKRGQIGDRGAVTYSRTATGATFSWTSLPCRAGTLAGSPELWANEPHGGFIMWTGQHGVRVSTDFAAAWIAEFGGRHG